MDVVLAPTLPRCLVVARPKDNSDRVLVVIAGNLDRSDVRGLSRLLLPKPERVQLACTLRTLTRG